MSKWYVLLDFDGQIVRWFDYPATGTVEYKQPKFEIDWNNYEECLF